MKKIDLNINLNSYTIGLAAGTATLLFYAKSLKNKFDIAMSKVNAKAELIDEEKAKARAEGFLAASDIYSKHSHRFLSKKEAEEALSSYRIENGSGDETDIGCWYIKYTE